MLTNQGFNLWSDNYDQTVQVSEENHLYPFAGYKKILNTIFNEVMQKENSKVLDIGFGTGVLTSKLYANGHQIDGVDFSSKMISIAQSKMPNANLFEWDISVGLPPEILENKYDSIISTYTLHHLTDEEKISFITDLIPLLKKGGKIVIGDISFENRGKLDKCRQESIEYWDDDEFYFVHDEIKSSLPYPCEFHSISHCGGVFIISE
ncbi:class I SAM-dependent methyltransferase [Sporosarcina aquimarina]|uniref:class I SAM-dependent methyltransferase n=1 Tax=Sporosarcina aquimarina TaxID=114975 RepID=UPI00204237FA|nr:class I SAM-dependent methyltransferase [Sporosarcina aquimarina]MCM3757637.1 class I SAM-dependent methyltransferase [Sporosarcina aquimarina]